MFMRQLRQSRTKCKTKGRRQDVLRCCTACLNSTWNTGDRAFPVAASRVWNSLPHHVTSAQSLPVFGSRLKTHLFSRSFRWLYCHACEVTLVISDTLIVVLTYLLTYLLTVAGPLVWNNLHLKPTRFWAYCLGVPSVAKDAPVIDCCS